MRIKKPIDQLVADVVAKDIGSGSATKEARARLLATGIFEKFAEWIEAEADADTEPSVTVAVTENMLVGMASLALANPELLRRQAEIATYLGKSFTEQILDIIEKTRADALRAARGDRQ